ncbi:MAG: aconitase X catalytic domain-containing protein, partial [Peptococcaceae bacterium]|nr:aconitase X catalytic domain-containing protein [Peptococcaceae bacterium]
MILNDEEKKILDGGQGYLAQKCMNYLIRYGEAAGAARLVDIDGTADIHPGKINWFPDYSITMEEVADAAKRGERFKVPTFSNKPNPGLIVDGCEGCGTWPSSDPAYCKQRLDEYKPLYLMGMVPTLSCDYYLTSSYWPTAGQHCSWGESSAIPWANAVLGARCNFDGCFASAYLGKIPEYDLHLDENRTAAVLVDYADGPLKNDMEYDLFGWAASEKLEMKVPAFVGIGRPTVSQLVKMNSSLNTGGQVRMYHIPGITPEASSLEEAFKGAKPRERLTITRSDLRRVYDIVNYAKDPDVEFVYLGCPHYNIVEIQKAAARLYGKKIKTDLWIMTSPPVYDMAVKMGCKDIIERAGGKLMSGTCAGELRG